MAVNVAYLAFIPIAALCFAWLGTRSAILVVLIGGWPLLPVGHYPQDEGGSGLAWWVTGIALPSDMLLTKAWIAPAVAFAGAALRDPKRLYGWRPAAIDAPMAAWVLWPLVDGLRSGADPAPAIAALYVAGAWGLPWLIGRIWFTGREGRLAVLRALALSGLANLPVAVVEGVRPAMLYRLVYGYQPFQADGVARYVGYRPVGFLEDGNLYGLWTALAAYAALWLARDRHGADRRRWIALAVVDVAMAIAAQSAGALVLLLLGLAGLLLWKSRIFLPVAGAAAALLLLGALVHLSGIVPLQRLAHTGVGERIIGAMRAIGRGSFLWRFSQDSRTLATIAAHPLAGTAQWDWWRRYGTRPWGQALLLAGQYGLIGLALAWGALLTGVVAASIRLRAWRERLTGDAALPLAIIVVLALLDATLNAFFFSPAILAAGVIAAVRFERQPSLPRAVTADRGSRNPTSRSIVAAMPSEQTPCP